MENTKVILYCRVSTDEQAEKGHSLKQQEESLISYCNKMQYKVLKIYKEDHSAKNFNRPEWKELRTFVKANKNHVAKVLYTKWDRFSRSSEQAYPVLAEFRKMGVELNAIEQPLDFSQSNYKIMLAVYLAQGEMERDNISDRTIKGTLQAKKNGYFCGKAPYGYDNARDEFKKSILKPNLNAIFVKQAFKEVAKGIEPVEVIRKRLYNSGMKLQRSAFSDMLKNIIYTGKIIIPEFQKEPMSIVNGRFEPLIDFETFNKVQNVFKGKRWYGIKPKKENDNFPLRDFFVCEVCGRQITGSVSKGRSNTYPYYHCRNKCSTRISVKQTHNFASSLLSNLHINRNVKDLFVDILKDTESNFNGNRAKELELKKQKKKSLQEKIVEVENMLLSNSIAPETFNNINSRLQGELMTIKNDIEVLNSKKDTIKGYIETGVQLLENMNVLFDEGDYEDKRILFGSLFNKKLILGNNGCRTVEVNEVLDVLTRVSKDFEGNKKRKAAISDSFSAKVPGAGVEPAWK